jgi:hypothetical protein
MSKKMFTAQEVAKMILEKTHETLKKHEELLKSKNSAHEIDMGEEPNNDEAECPESLKGEGGSNASKSEPKKVKSPVAESEDPEMEDEPLSGDYDSEDESEEEESEEEESEEQEPKKFFKKSESGMFTVQYMRLAKDDSEGGEETVDFGDMDKEENPEFHIRETQAGKKPKKVWSNPTKKEINYSRSGMKNSRPSSAADQKRYEAEAKERSKKLKEEAAATKKN